VYQLNNTTARSSRQISRPIAARSRLPFQRGSWNVFDDTAPNLMSALTPHPIATRNLACCPACGILPLMKRRRFFVGFIGATNRRYRDTGYFEGDLSPSGFELLRPVAFSIKRVSIARYLAWRPLRWSRPECVSVPSRSSQRPTCPKPTFSGCGCRLSSRCGEPRS
jgi:hypothetical protein